MRPTVERLQEALGHTFRDGDLIDEALTHSSYANENDTADNERLEFLGDAVLQTCTTLMLVERFPTKREGELSRMRSKLVRTETLAEIARILHLGPLIRFGRGEQKTGGSSRTRNLANATEAVLGALFLETGLPHCIEVVRGWMDKRIEALDSDAQKKREWKDARSRLQEIVQESDHAMPEYETVARDGPDHDPIFTVEVRVHGRTLGTGRAGNKRHAARKAAEDALHNLPS